MNKETCQPFQYFQMNMMKKLSKKWLLIPNGKKYKRKVKRRTRRNEKIVNPTHKFNLQL